LRKTQLILLRVILLPALSLVAAIGPLAIDTTRAASRSLFQNLNGRWTGWGWIELASGDRERVRCRITFTLTGGKQASQNLRCASVSYKIDATSILINSAGAISGSWSETTYDARGSITGRASKKHMAINLIGNNLSAGMSVTSEGECTQRLKIRPRGVDIRIISVGLKRC